MNPVERSEILPLGDYEAVREPFRVRIIEEKRRRRVELGTHISAIFENHDSVLLQVQEMLRTERISREDAVQHELDTYNALIPGADELSLTLFVQIPEREERDRMLVALAGLEESVALEVDGVVVSAKGEPRDGSRADRTTAVHYFRFSLPPGVAEKVRARDVQRVLLTVNHSAYTVRAELDRGLVAELAYDLS